MNTYGATAATLTNATLGEGPGTAHILSSDLSAVLKRMNAYLSLMKKNSLSQCAGPKCLSTTDEVQEESYHDTLAQRLIC